MSEIKLVVNSVSLFAFGSDNNVNYQQIYFG